MTEKLFIRKTKKTRHNGGWFYVKPGCRVLNHEQILQVVASGVDFELENCETHRELIYMIANRESGRKLNVKLEREVTGDVALLNRIIRNGGLIKYATLLEEKINENSKV